MGVLCVIRRLSPGVDGGGGAAAAEPRAGDAQRASPGVVGHVIRFCLEHKLVVVLLLAAILFWGLRTMPFEPGVTWVPRDPIPVDAIPDIGENQQVVFTDWPGRSPRDVEDQVTYPLTSLLQGTPGVTDIRAFSMFGFSIVYVIFDEQREFYWCRSRLLEKLATAAGRLPEDARPALGPDATGLSQIFWYTLEPTRGGFDLQELRSVQDWYVRYALQATPDVAEVASVGGHVREYQVDVDPDAMRAHEATLPEIFAAVQRANLDVGAETIEWNGVEYVVRGRGLIRSVADIEDVVVREAEGVAIRVRNVARVQVAPALRRGALDKGGVEAVGGVVLARYGANPLAVIERVKERIAEITPGLPDKTLPDGTISKVKIVPFYDRSTLIHETLDTLHDALYEQILVTTFVVLLFLWQVRSSIVISLSMPLAVLVCFILMRLLGVDSNLMSLAGIAIAIGTLVDMGIILTENIVRHLETDRDRKPLREIVYEAAREIGPAVVTAIVMSVVAFLPVFALTGPEGKLFRPLAYTKTFALLGALLVAILVLPSIAQVVFARRQGQGLSSVVWPVAFGALGAGLYLYGWPAAGLAAVGWAGFLLLETRLPRPLLRWSGVAASVLVMAGVLWFLTRHWMPLGPGAGLTRNLLIVLGINLAWASVRVLFIDFYPYFLGLFIKHKAAFLALPVAVVLLGVLVWLGLERTLSWLPGSQPAAGAAAEADARLPIYDRLYTAGVRAFPGLGREFMPPLDEGSYLYMPTLMPHAGVGAALEAISLQDRAISAIPEVETVVGKVGRAETAIDPAPVAMIETVINYKTEYRHDPLTGELVVDEAGQPIRQWRPHIRTPDDIWAEIQRAAEVPGVTGAPRLQPIAARLVMLQSGTRAPVAVKILGQNLQELERVGFEIAEVLKTVPGVAAEAVVPDRVVGKPYLEIELDRQRMARYGVNIRDVQEIVEIALGGVRTTSTLEGRARYPVRVRYQRELRDNEEAIERILVPAANGTQVPLSQLATIEYVRGPQEIKSEGNFLVSYVLFDTRPGFAPVEVVEAAARELLEQQQRGTLAVPAGVHYEFAGSYENQVRFQQRLSVVLPVSLFLLFLLLYLQFRSVPIALIVYSGIPVAWAGGFIGLWLVAQPWFFDFSVFGTNLRELLHFQVYNLSAAVWVGFLALFSVTTDDGVVLATYLGHEFRHHPPQTRADIRRNVLAAGARRVRPCLMTSATTVLSLLPVLTSQGRGADLMIPIALPVIGGLSIELLSLFVLPVLYCSYQELRWQFGGGGRTVAAPA